MIYELIFWVLIISAVVRVVDWLRAPSKPVQRVSRATAPAARPERREVKSTPPPTSVVDASFEDIE